MSKLSKLLQVTHEEKQRILQGLNVTEESFEGDVKTLREWITMCPHLPQDDDDNKIRISLLNSKMSLEKAKKTIEGYYRMRTIYSDFFDKLQPDSDLFIRGKHLTVAVSMPKLTKDLCRVTISKICDVNGEAEDGLWYYLSPLMIGEIRILHDFCVSNIIVVDMINYNIKNLLKFTPSINKKLVNILNLVGLRIQEIHLVNCPPVLDRVMIILRQMLPAKLVSRIHCHPNSEGLLKHIQKDCLPSDYGGTQPSIDELYSDWCYEIEHRQQLFRDLLNYKSKEEIDTPTREIFGMGTEGSFKKLAID